jgi:hypothetical protein
MSGFEIHYGWQRIGGKEIGFNVRGIEGPGHEDALMLISIGDIR